MVWFLKTQKQTFLQPHGKLEVFVRHCFFSTISQHKKRFPDFSREKCHQNLINTIDKAKANLTFFLDTAKGQDHFIKREENVIEIQAGSEATSFLKLLDHIESLSLHPDTVLYFVEDDYLHRAGPLQPVPRARLEAGQDAGCDHRGALLFHAGRLT